MTDNSASPFSLRDICGCMTSWIGVSYTKTGTHLWNAPWEEDQLCLLWRWL